MARFHFNLHECGDIVIDEDGVERADLAAVRTEAIEAAREVMGAEVKQGRLCLSCHIEVTDEHGERVLVIPFRDALTITGQ